MPQIGSSSALSQYRTCRSRSAGWTRARIGPTTDGPVTARIAPASTAPPRDRPSISPAVDRAERDRGQHADDDQPDHDLPGVSWSGSAGSRSGRRRTRSRRRPPRPAAGRPGRRSWPGSRRWCRAPAHEPGEQQQDRARARAGGWPAPGSRRPGARSARCRAPHERSVTPPHPPLLRRPAAAVRQRRPGAASPAAGDGHRRQPDTPTWAVVKARSRRESRVNASHQVRIAPDPVPVAGQERDVDEQPGHPAGEAAEPERPGRQHRLAAGDVGGRAEVAVPERPGRGAGPPPRAGSGGPAW